MKRKLKFLLSAFLVLILIFSLTGCGKDEIINKFTFKSSPYSAAGKKTVNWEFKKNKDVVVTDASSGEVLFSESEWKWERLKKTDPYEPLDIFYRVTQTFLKDGVEIKYEFGFVYTEEDDWLFLQYSQNPEIRDRCGYERTK